MEYAYAALTFLAALGGLFLLKLIVLDQLKAWAKKTDWKGDDLLVELLDQIRVPEGALLALYWAVRPLEIPTRMTRLLYIALILALTYRVVRILQEISGYALKSALGPPGAGDQGQQATVRNLTYLVNGLLWVAGAVFALGNLGVNVTAMLTGLGIGGVAVALAAQAVLSDLFSAVAIFLDQPFVVGDAIAVDGFQGTVEHIGVKTTRVRALSGEMLVFSNSYLTSSRIRNFQLLRERRILFSFGVSRQTSPDKIRRVVEAVKEVVSKAAQVRLDRAHFKGIGEFSLDFEVVYFVQDSDYNRSMDINEGIQLSLLEALRKEGVSLAYPTRLVISAAA